MFWDHSGEGWRVEAVQEHANGSIRGTVRLSTSADQEKAASRTAPFTFLRLVFTPCVCLTTKTPTGASLPKVRLPFQRPPREPDARLDWWRFRWQKLPVCSCAHARQPWQNRSGVQPSNPTNSRMRSTAKIRERPASYTIVDRPARARNRAALKPAIPPPTMTASTISEPSRKDV